MRTSAPVSPRQRGSALILCMLLTVALVALGATFLSVSTTDRAIASNNASSTRALHLAQAAIEDARVTLATTNVNTLLGGTGALFTNKAMGGGTYSLTVSNNFGAPFPDALAAADVSATNDADGILVLTATGQYGNARRRVEVVVQRSISDFRYALWGKSKLTISSSGYTDSYNSSTGSYSAGTATSHGDVYCGTTNCTLSGSSMVKGDLDVSGATGPASGHVSGTTSLSDPAQTISAVACPGSYPTAASMPTGSGITYNATTGALTVSGGNNITLPIPPTSYYFSSVTLSGGSTMTINGSQHVDIYVSGGMTASGGGVVNTSSLPTRLTLYACGTGTTQWTVSGGSGAYFAVHAPTRKVTVSGSSDIWGAIIADEVDDSGGSTVHYDQALGGGNAAAAVLARSWREIFL